ncbi:MAG: response regulator transcription factor [Myxococcota bacterium]
MESVLVVEDDPNIARGLQRILQLEGFSVGVAADGETALEWAVDRRPDLVLLDVMLPRLNGFEVLRELRRMEVHVPVIMVTAKGEELDVVRGLDLGADDYLTKPFAVAELTARVRAVLRRKRQFDAKSEQLVFGDVEVDFVQHKARVQGKPVALTAREMALLRLFVQREGEALAREEIITKVWGYDYEGTDRTLDNFVLRLRQKLEPASRKPQHFTTVRGIGYRFSRDKAS